MKKDKFLLVWIHKIDKCIWDSHDRIRTERSKISAQGKDSKTQIPKIKEYKSRTISHQHNNNNKNFVRGAELYLFWQGNELEYDLDFQLVDLFIFTLLQRFAYFCIFEAKVASLIPESETNDIWPKLRIFLGP